MLTEEEEIAGKIYDYKYLFLPKLTFPRCTQHKYPFVIFLYYYLKCIIGAHSEWGANIRRTRIKIRKLCKTQVWFWTIVLLVFLNTCTVAVEHYGQPEWLTNFLGKCEWFNILQN